VSAGRETPHSVTRVVAKDHADGVGVVGEVERATDHHEDVGVERTPLDVKDELDEGLEELFVAHRDTDHLETL
jgi:hypothetical protein